MASTQSGMANSTQASSSGYISNKNSLTKSTVLGAADEVSTTRAEGISGLLEWLQLNDILYEEACKDPKIIEEQVLTVIRKHATAIKKAFHETRAQLVALKDAYEDLKGISKRYQEEKKPYCGYLRKVKHALEGMETEPVSEDTAANLPVNQRFHDF